MITLQDKLYESLLDDEEELVNDDTIALFIKDRDSYKFNKIKL